jgi:phosphoenolpyruvate carboxykinase (ATP)
MIHPLLSDYVISRNDYNEKELVTMVGERREETINSQGFIVVNNYPYTGRSPKDRFIVKNRGSRLVDFNQINQPISQRDFDTLLEVALSYAQEKELFSMKGYAGASPTYRVPIEVITEDAWQSLFAHEAFFTSDITSPELTIISLPHFKFDPTIHPTHSEVFIGIDLYIM